MSESNRVSFSLSSNEVDCTSDILVYSAIEDVEAGRRFKPETKKNAGTKVVGVRPEGFGDMGRKCHRILHSRNLARRHSL